MRCVGRVATAFCLGSVVFGGAFLRGQSNTDSTKPRAIEVKMIESEGFTLPAEFQVALYENLVQQLQKKSDFELVYRDGDRSAAQNADLIILQSTVQAFRQGGERARQVTTVAGATSITVHCLFTNTKGESLLERDVQGKVRFFGGNLKATNDFAKKAANVAHEYIRPKDWQDDLVGW
jgi:hypothetical protein